MISISKCERILGKHAKKYSDKEILIIRKFLYQMAKIDYELFKHVKSNSINNDKNEKTEQTI